MENVLEVEGLGVRFGREVVLRDVTFSVPRGGSLAVIGPNGAGKTVLFRALVGAIPHEGVVRWAPGARVGYVPQKLDLDRGLPITGNELLAARARVAGAAAADLPAVAKEVGLDEAVLARPIGVLSGGQFNRLLTAFALVGSPDVLLLDEPTAGVDEPGQEIMHAMLERARQERGLTVCEISHDVSFVHAHASCVLCLGAGEAFFGPPGKVLTAERLQAAFGAPLLHHHDHRADG